MTIKNIHKIASFSAVGTILVPGKVIPMPVEYYASHKAFIDKHVTDKKAKIDGMDEYTALISGKSEETEEVPVTESTDTPALTGTKKAETKAEASVEDKSKADADAKAKAEAETKAKAKAEAEAKVKAAKAEAEAKAKATKATAAAAATPKA